MAQMSTLDPAPRAAIGAAGWELLASEAGRYATGLRATVQLWNESLQMCQQLNLAHPESCREFVAAVAEKGQCTDTEVREALLTLIAGIEGVLRQRVEASNSQATELIGLAADAELFHSPDGDAFATIQIGGHDETWPLRTKAFRRWLARLFYEQQEKAPGTQALQDAITVLEGKALFDGPEYPVFTRLADYQGTIYLDLANETWEAVEITATGWRVIATPPVKFRRARGMLPLPSPVAGGRLDDLRVFLNISDEQAWTLLKAWMVQTFRPRGPYPVAVFHGEQGSAKSTTSRMIRAVVDPNTAAVRAEPRDGRDLIIAASNGWIIALDNLSHLAPWLSDAICRLATGGGFATRELYTDSEEVLLNAQRPVMLNGIEELATRGDLLDRSIILYLPAIPEHRRRPEAELWRDFEATQPLILGALLDGVTTALGNVAAVTFDRLPRMTDFAVWAIAAAPSLGYDAGEFLKAYRSNRGAANELALEASLIASLIRTLAETGFTGTASELLQQLNEQAGDTLKRQKTWPSNGRALSNALRRITPNLHEMGVEVAFGQRAGGTGRRLITIEKNVPPEYSGNFASHPSLSSQTLEKQSIRGDATTKCDANASCSDVRITEKRETENPHQSKLVTQRDGCDAKMQIDSNHEEVIDL